MAKSWKTQEKARSVKSLALCQLSQQLLMQCMHKA
nr:MAG TPA: hypothetical protein [Caudoviricetes sp.]